MTTKFVRISLFKFTFLVTLVLVALIDPTTAAKKKNKHKDADPEPNKPYVQDVDKEFTDFCTAKEIAKNTPEKIDKGKKILGNKNYLEQDMVKLIYCKLCMYSRMKFFTEECKRIGPLDFHSDDLNILFMIFAVLLYGAIVRSILKHYQVSLPYTVFIMASGMFVGMAAKYYCFEMYSFTALARLNAKVYLFVFLPVLLFESSFSISGHVFIKAAGQVQYKIISINYDNVITCVHHQESLPTKYHFPQVLLLAAPGMLLCTMCTAFTCYIFFTSYEWSLLESVFFGCIISATGERCSQFVIPFIVHSQSVIN